MRKLNLERLSHGKADANLGRGITYLASRASKLTYDLDRMEREYA